MGEVGRRQCLERSEQVTRPTDLEAVPVATAPGSVPSPLFSVAQPNKSLDRSADSLFLNLIPAAKVGCHRRARLTQTLGAK